MESELSKVINLDNVGIFKFETLTKKNIYVMYKKKETKISDIINEFELNYDCGLENANITYFSVELDRNVNDDKDKNPEELELSDDTQIKITIKDCNTYYDQSKMTLNKNEKEYNKMLEKNKDGFFVFIKTLVGTTVSLKIFRETTIYEIKRMMQNIYGTDESRMIFGGKQLEDSLTASYYKIMSESTIHMVANLRGGMYHETSGKNGNYLPLKNNILYVNLNPTELGL